MKKNNITIYDIADKLNITASTVSRALNDNPRISSSTKEKVIALAEKLNYRSNNIATALRIGKTNTIGVIVPRTDRDFFATVIRGIEESVQNSGYNVIICQTDDNLEKEKMNITTLLKAQVDGIIMSYAKESKSYKHFEPIFDQHVPLILFDRYSDSIDADAVVIDDYLGAYNATKHLIDQGCKKIVHFSGSENASIYKNRKEGYINALCDNDIKIYNKFIMESNLKLEAGRLLAKKILQWNKLPDAIFSSSDYAAMGAMQVLTDNHIHIPNTLSIVGFSNETFTSFVNPSLTTVDQHSKKIGQLCAKKILNRINSNNDDYITSKTVLNPELIIRKSSIKKVKETYKTDI